MPPASFGGLRLIVIFSCVLVDGLGTLEGSREAAAEGRVGSVASFELGYCGVDIALRDEMKH